MSKVYCGSDKLSKGYRFGTMEECINLKRVGLYGINKVDPNLLIQKSSIKDILKRRNKLAIEIAGLRGIISRYEPRIESIKDEEKRNEALDIVNKTRIKFNEIKDEFNELNSIRDMEMKSEREYKEKKRIEKEQLLKDKSDKKELEKQKKKEEINNSKMEKEKQKELEKEKKKLEKDNLKIEKINKKILKKESNVRLIEDLIYPNPIARSREIHNKNDIKVRSLSDFNPQTTKPRSLSDLIPPVPISREMYNVKDIKVRSLSDFNPQTTKPRSLSDLIPPTSISKDKQSEKYIKVRSLSDFNPQTTKPRSLADLIPPDSFSEDK